MFEREINPRRVTQADLVVGIASLNEADSISYPTRKMSQGLKKYFPDLTSVIINVDNNSPDDTRGGFLSTPTRVPKIYITTPPGTAGKGYNLENLFRKAVELDAKAAVLVDADLRSITPEWAKHFLQPILSGYDLATPLYARHKYDATITNNICFPLVYGLLCRNLRQPIGGDFALSRRLIEHIVLQMWHRTTEEYGIDIFMSLNGLLGGFKVAQVGLGVKEHKPSAPKLGPMFIQVVSTAFLMLLKNFPVWRGRKRVEEVEKFGLKELGPAQKLSANRAVVKTRARRGYKANAQALQQFLSPGVLKGVKGAFGKKIKMDSPLWVDVVYDMLHAFREAEDREALVEALRPLYFARIATFMDETWELSTPEAEEKILAQARLFHQRRQELIRKLT